LLGQTALPQPPATLRRAPTRNRNNRRHTFTAARQKYLFSGLRRFDQRRQIVLCLTDAAFHVFSVATFVATWPNARLSWSSEGCGMFRARGRLLELPKARRVTYLRQFHPPECTDLRE